MQYFTILFLFFTIFSHPISTELVPIPLISYCRFNATNKCVAVDIWFGRYHEAKRLFPLECTVIPCPNGTFCERNSKCWQEVKLKGQGQEEKWIYELWTDF